MNLELNSSNVGVPLKTINESKPGFCWGIVNDLLIFESPVQTITQQTKSNNSNVVKLRWNEEMCSDKITRALISQSAALFTQLAKIKSAGRVTSSEIIKMSRKYRSVIHAATSMIDIRESFSLFELMKNVEMVWHLCEILFLDFHPPGILLNQLLSWLRWHHDENQIRAEQVVKSNNPVSDPNFWKVINCFLFDGQIEQVKDFVVLYREMSDNLPEEEIERIAIVIEILNKMPRYTYGQLSHEVDMKWTSWSAEVKEMLDTGLFDASPRLETIMKVLSGNEATLASIATTHGLHWSHLLISKILFRDPFLKDKDLSVLAVESLKCYNLNDGSLTTHDRLLLATFNYDLMEVVKESCTLNDNWWFVSHFVDLLHSGDALQSHSIENESKLREFLLLDFADALMADSSFWPIAIDYYDSCGATGRFKLELMLERIPITSEKVALKILDICNKRSMKSLYKTICRAISQSMISKGNLSSALIWSLKCEDSNISSFIANEMLKKYSKVNGCDSNDLSAKIIDSDILSSLGPSMLVSERLTFLAKYYELRQLLKDPNLTNEASDLVVQLISSKISPSFFMMTLLSDSIELLSKSSTFDVEKCCTLLAALENLIDSRKDVPGKTRIKDVVEEEEFEKKEDQLRRAINACLARTIVE